MLCAYGCEQKGIYTTSNNRPCCSKHFNSCPAVRKKNSAGLEALHKIGKKDYSNLKGKKPWNKNKTSFSDSRIQCYADFYHIFTYPSQANSSYIRRIIFKENLLPYKCAKCEICDWKDQSLTFELDHINGIRNDNRLENLRFLCPNCHSQTSTFKGRNIRIRGKRTYTDEQLIEAVNETRNVRQLLFRLGLDPKGANYYTVQRHMLRLGLSFDQR